MRLIDADELLEHAYRDRLDSRKLIADMINNAPTVKEIPVKVPLDLVIKAKEEIINELKTGSCYECTYGCRSTINCENEKCSFKKAVLMVVKALEQEKKIGHWIEHPEIETSAPEYLMFYECSECGNKQCFCIADTRRRNYCGVCGSRMVGSQESEVSE